jgi:hypothetical protein
VEGYVEHYNNVLLNSAASYITPKDMLAGASRLPVLTCGELSPKNKSRRWTPDLKYPGLAQPRPENEVSMPRSNGQDIL